MAATDAKPVPQRNVAYRHYFPIYDNDGDTVSAAAGLDSEVSKDGAAFADCTNEATEIGTSGVYYLDLTSTEMDADCVVVCVKTSTLNAKTSVIVLYPQEGADIKVNVTHWDSVAQTIAGSYPAVAVQTFSNDDIPGELGQEVWVQMPDNAITAAKIAASALDNKGNWLKPTVAGRTLDVTATGEAGIDWANIGSPTTTVNLSGTTVKTVTDAVALPSSASINITGNITGNLSGSVGSVTGLNTAYIDDTISSRMATYTQPTGFLTATFPSTVASTTNITAGTLTTVTNLTNLPTMPTDWISSAGVSAAAVTKIQSGLSTYAGGDTAGTTTLLSRLSATRAGYLDNLSGGAVMLASSYAAPPSASTIAGEVWNSATASYVSAGTFGKRVQDLLLSASYTAPPTAASIADAVWDEAESEHTTAGSFGYNLDAQVSSAGGGGGASAADIWAYGSRTLTGTVSADVVSISGDTAAADNFETMLDGTGGATLSLGQLSVYAETGNAVSFSADDGYGFYSGGAYGAAVLEASDAQGTVRVYGLNGAPAVYLHSTTWGTGTHVGLVIQGGIGYGTETSSTPLEATITSAVWNKATSSHTSAGTFGKRIQDLLLSDSYTPPPTAGSIADAVWDEIASGHTTTGSFGDIITTHLDYTLSNLADDVAAVAGQVDTELTSSHGAGSWQTGTSISAADVWSYSTREITALPSAPTNWLSDDAVSAAAVTKIQTGLSTYDGSDTTGTTTLLGRLSEIRADLLDTLTHLDMNVSSVPGDTSDILSTAHGAGTWTTATGFAQPGDAMTLTSGERTAIADEVEAQIINEADSERVLQAIIDKIEATMPDLDTLSLNAIASAVRTELTTELARIDASISSRFADADRAAYKAEITDSVLQTSIAGVETVAGEYSLTGLVLAMTNWEISGSDLVLYRTDGTTEFVRKTLTTDASLIPVKKIQ